MAHEDSSHSKRTEAMLEEAEALTWALIDDQLNEADAAKLAQLLEQHEQARARYIECAQLHVDLQDHFTPPTDAEGKSPGVVVLPNLLPGLPGIESRPPVAE
jgi:anti-sigma factor RsiW